MIVYRCMWWINDMDSIKSCTAMCIVHIWQLFCYRRNSLVLYNQWTGTSSFPFVSLTGEQTGGAGSELIWIVWFRTCLHPSLTNCRSENESRAHASHSSMTEIYKKNNHAFLKLNKSDAKKEHTHFYIVHTHSFSYEYTYSFMHLTPVLPFTLNLNLKWMTVVALWHWQRHSCLF